MSNISTLHQAADNKGNIPGNSFPPYALAEALRNAIGNPDIIAANNSTAKRVERDAPHHATYTIGVPTQKGNKANLLCIMDISYTDDGNSITATLFKPNRLPLLGCQTGEFIPIATHQFWPNKNNVFVDKNRDSALLIMQSAAQELHPARGIKPTRHSRINQSSSSHGRG